MPDTLNIRPLTQQDRPAWHRLWSAYLEFYETALPPQVFDTAFDRLTSTAPGEFKGLIAELNGAPVGLAHYLVHRNLWALEDTCYLGDLFTTPAARGRGVGRALIRAVQDAATAAGCGDVYWQTQAHNQTARRLYDSLARKTPFVVYEMTGHILE